MIRRGAAWFIRIGVFCLSLGLGGIGFGATTPAAPTILKTLKSGTNLLVSVNVPKGWRAVTLESRAQTNAGAWVPRAVVRTTGRVVFKVPATLSRQSLRVRGQLQEPLPQAFYRGAHAFGKRAASYWRPDQGRGEAIFVSAAGTMSDVSSIPLADTRSRTVVESDIWKMSGDTLYFFNQLRGLQVIDVRNPDAPVVTGTLELPAAGEQLYVLDAQHVVLLTGADCASDQQSRVIVVDVSAATPRIQASLVVEGGVVESRLVGTALYVAAEAARYVSLPDDWQSGTTVTSFDLSNPAAPVVRSTLWFPGQNNTIFATDRWLFVARQYGNGSDRTSIRLLDISAPDGTMRDVAGLRTAGVVADKFKMNVAGDVFTAVSERFEPETSTRNSWVTTFETFSLANPANPTPLGRLTLAPGERLFATRFDGTRAYAVTYLRIDPLWVVDLSDPTNPDVVGSVEVPGWSTYLEPMGDRLLTLGVETNRVAVSLFSLQNPAQPALLSRVPLGENYSWSEANSDEKALTVLREAQLILLPYQGTTSNGWASRVQLIDLKSDTLTARGTIDRAFAPRRATLHRGRVLSLSNRELLGVDISDRDHPLVRVETELAWPVNQVFAQGDYVLELAKGSAWSGESAAAVRVALATEPGTVLNRINVGGWPIVGSTLHNGALFLLQSPSSLYPGMVLFNALSDSATGASQTDTNLLLTVLDVSALPAIQLLSQTPISSADSAGAAGNFQALWPQPNLLIWFNSGYGFYLSPMLDFLPVGGVAPVTFVSGSSRPGSPGSVLAGALTTGTVGAVSGDSGAVIGAQSMALLPYWRPWWNCGGTRLLAFDVNDSAKPKLVSTLQYSPTNAWGFSSALASQGLVYFSHEQSVRQTTLAGSWRLGDYLDVIDYTDPTTPTIRPAVNVPGQLMGLSRDGALLYLLGTSTSFVSSRETVAACAYDGVAAYQVASLSLPTTWPRPVLMGNDTLYLGRAAAEGHTNHALEAWSLTDQGKFTRRAASVLAQPASALAVFGNLVAVQTSGYQVSLFDTTKPNTLLPCGQGAMGCLWPDLNQADGLLGVGLWLPLDDYGVTWVPASPAR